jgi:transposase InsO family protein
MATREIVGWSMSDRLQAGFACDALLMAIQHRQPPKGLIHHSDPWSWGQDRLSLWDLPRPSRRGRATGKDRSLSRLPGIER